MMLALPQTAGDVKVLVEASYQPASPAMFDLAWNLVAKDVAMNLAAASQTEEAR